MKCTAKFCILCMPSSHTLNNNGPVPHFLDSQKCDIAVNGNNKYSFGVPIFPNSKRKKEYMIAFVTLQKRKKKLKC